MRKSKATTGFDTLTDAELQTKAEGIDNAMDSTPNFPNTTPVLSVVHTALLAYSSALINAQTRNKNAIALKNEARQTLENLLVQLASSVNAIANGNLPMLVSSGYDVSKTAEPVTLIKPTTIVVEDGQNAGELMVKVPSVKGARSYVHQYALSPLTPNSEWTQVMTTTSKYTFRNLTSAQKYWCRVAAVGPHDQVVVSDAVCRVAQ